MSSREDRRHSQQEGGDVTEEDLKFIAVNSKLSIRCRTPLPLLTNITRDREARELLSSLTGGTIDQDTFTRVVSLCYPSVGTETLTLLSVLSHNYIFLSRH